MHILFLSHYYPPEVNAPASRTYECAKTWVAMGHRVTVVCPAPGHPRGILYPGYENRWTDRQMIDGIEVIRIWTYLAANEGFGKRVLNFLSYPFSILMHLRQIPMADVVVSSSPQFFAGLAGWMLKRRRRPWVLEIRDLYPESIIAVGAMRKGPLIRVLEWIERAAYRHADAMVSVTDSFVSHIRERRGRDGIAVFKNGVDLSRFAGTVDKAGADAFRREIGAEGKFLVTYVGTHGAAHGLDTVLRAAERLRDEPGFMMALIGDGSERRRLEEEARALGIENVRIIGMRPKGDMPAIWAASDATMVLLRQSDAFKSVLPSKMVEAMAMRIPVILGVEGEARELLEQAGGGVAITPEDDAALADTIRKMARDPEAAKAMGVRGQQFVRANFDRAVIARRYAEFLEQVAKQSQ